MLGGRAEPRVRRARQVPPGKPPASAGIDQRWQRGHERDWQRGHERDWQRRHERDWQRRHERDWQRRQYRTATTGAAGTGGGTSSDTTGGTAGSSGTAGSGGSDSGLSGVIEGGGCSCSVPGERDPGVKGLLSLLFGRRSGHGGGVRDDSEATRPLRSAGQPSKNLTYPTAHFRGWSPKISKQRARGEGTLDVNLGKTAKCASPPVPPGYNSLKTHTQA